MCSLISIIMQDSSLCNSFKEADNIKIYSKSTTGWDVKKEIPLSIDFSQSIVNLREQLTEIILSLDDCKIIAGKEVSGLPYNMFDKMGFDIFNINVISDDVLDGILSDIESGNDFDDIQKALLLSAKPVETSVAGEYYFDLIALQKEMPEISSKKVLHPFFNEIPFMKLELICSHVPPWIEKCGYEITTTKYRDGKIIATISNKLYKK